MKTMSLVSKFHSIMIGIVILGFLVRLHGFTNPIADWHSWRQADTSAVSRNFIKSGYDILHPRYDDLSNVASGMDNPQGYRFVEFPIYNLFQAGLYQVFGVFTLEEWGRLVTIASSLFSVIFVYLITKRYAGNRAGLFSAGLYAFLPYSIYYGRVILPDTMMVTAVLGAIYFFLEWCDEKKPRLNKMFFSSVFLATISLLLKPYAAFFLLPLLYPAYKKFGLSFLVNWRLWLYLLVTLIPLVFWRLWMTQFPEGIPSNLWLLNGNGIRFRPAFFRWIIYERLTKLLLGFVGAFFLFPGVAVILKNKNLWFITALVASAILYVIVFATGNVQHDYYQILILPSVVMVGGIGIDWMLKKLPGIAGNIIIAVLLIFTFFLSWQQVKGYFYIDHPSIVLAGKTVDLLTEKDALVVALYNGDTSFLYQTNRQGWPTLENGLDDLIKKGADYLVLADPTDEERHFGSAYKTVASTKEYAIFDLHTKL